MSHDKTLNATIGGEFTVESTEVGTWEFEFDADAPGAVVLSVVRTDDGQGARLDTRLFAPDVDHLIGWLSNVRAQMEELPEELPEEPPEDAPPEDRPDTGQSDPGTDGDGDSDPLPDAEVELSPAELDRAVAFNKGRPYTSALWRQIQARVQAGVDGAPGPDTARKVANYQHHNGLQPDGKVGPTTLSRMQIGPIRSVDAKAFFFLGHLQIDADGAPNAYNPDDTGIDYLDNAGRPGNWWGLSVDSAGQPYIQGADDPFPGYYVSTTALVDGAYPRNDPRRYVDSTTTPYVVMPSNIHTLNPIRQVHKGDLVAVARASEPLQVVYAIYADVGPKKTLDPDSRFGEGSIALAQALGHDPFVIRSGVKRAAKGLSSPVIFVVFPGSGTGKLLSNAELARRGADVFNAWGGIAKLRHVLAQVTPP